MPGVQKCSTEYGITPVGVAEQAMKSKICEKQRAVKARHYEKAVSREFQEGEPMYYRNFSGRGV